MRKRIVVGLGVALVVGVVGVANPEASVNVWIDCGGYPVGAHAYAAPYNGSYMYAFELHMSGPTGEADCQNCSGGGYHATGGHVELGHAAGEYVAYACAGTVSDDGSWWQCDWDQCTAE